MESRGEDDESGDLSPPPAGRRRRTRTRTGCLNCRRRRRKCEIIPFSVLNVNITPRCISSGAGVEIIAVTRSTTARPDVRS